VQGELVLEFTGGEKAGGMVDWLRKGREYTRSKKKHLKVRRIKKEAARKRCRGGLGENIGRLRGANDKLPGPPGRRLSNFVKHYEGDLWGGKHRNRLHKLLSKGIRSVDWGEDHGVAGGGRGSGFL